MGSAKRESRCHGSKPIVHICFKPSVFGTSDSKISDMLMLSKVRNLQVSGADWERIGSTGSETSHNWERISNDLGADREQIPSHSCDLFEPIRGSESPCGSAPDPLP